MRRIPLAALAVLFAPGLALPEDKRKVLAGHPDAVQVVLPKGKVTVSYVEAAEGMMVYVESKGVTVKGRKVSIGDGRVAVQFEAKTDGFYTPEGKRNVAAVEYEAGAAVKLTKENRRVWAEKAGEVYVLTPDITFEEKK